MRVTKRRSSGELKAAGYLGGGRIGVWLYQYVWRQLIWGVRFQSCHISCMKHQFSSNVNDSYIGILLVSPDFWSINVTFQLFHIITSVYTLFFVFIRSFYMGNLKFFQGINFELFIQQVDDCIQQKKVSFFFPKVLTKGCWGEWPVDGWTPIWDATIAMYQEYFNIVAREYPLDHGLPYFILAVRGKIWS